LEAGSSKTTNVVLLAVAAKQLGITQEEFSAALKDLVKPQFLEMNQKALALGYAIE
jgi:indolepyruvate ferredoxin oxidoreductase beta subunit